LLQRVGWRVFEFFAANLYGWDLFQKIIASIPEIYLKYNINMTLPEIYLEFGQKICRWIFEKKVAHTKVEFCLQLLKNTEIQVNLLILV
jgi:hypothetical protein